MSFYTRTQIRYTDLNSSKFICLAFVQFVIPSIVVLGLKMSVIILIGLTGKIW